jgi:hypothetical protein
MDEIDPHKKVLQGILSASRGQMARNIKQKYASPAPNLEAGAKVPVPGAEPGEEQNEPTDEDDMKAMLEQMMSQGQAPQGI